MAKNDTSKTIFDASVDWESDKVIAAEKSRKTAWIVAFAFGIVALVQGIAISVMMPLKTIELRAIRVDKETGYSDIVTPVSGDPLSYETVKDKYWVAKYVRLRERYSNQITGNDYDVVNLLSTPRVANAYDSAMSPDNPTSPLNVYGERGRVFIHIISVNLQPNHSALVRFTKTVEQGSLKKGATHWIATVAYSYEPMNLTEAQRRVNPVQFQVTDYRVSSETISSAPSAQ